MRRVMLIAWRWREFERAGTVVTPELLSGSDYSNVLADVASFKDVLFDEFIVCEQQPDGRAPIVKPTALVIRTNVRRMINQQPCDCCIYLDQLIAHYQQEPSEILLFLHRKDGFSEEEVSYFLPKIKTGKCFLIGGGRDNIYYREERNQGLLGEDGYFFRKISEPGSPSVRVANRQEKIVYLRYFDKVWMYYKHQFYTKIYELKEDLLRHFYQLELDRPIISYEELNSHLEENRGLALRVASFIDDDCSKLTKEEKDELDSYGQDAAKSYEFGALKVNLETEKNITTQYIATSDLLHSYFFTKKEPVIAIATVRDLLIEINKAFTALLEQTKALK